jgi:hypothetical protein
MPESVSHRRSTLGLSNGVIILAIAGAFWFGVAAFSKGFRPWLALALAMGAALIVGASILLIRREASALKPSDLDAAQRKRMAKVFRWVSVFEVAFGVVAVFLCNWLGRKDLTTTAVALIVSLHFLPLANLFRLRAYYVTSYLGCAVSLFAVGQTTLYGQYSLEREWEPSCGLLRSS